MNMSELATPSLILDKSRLVTNASFMRDRASKLEVNLRPHMKTSKCIDVMKIALQGLPERVTVSTLTEAEYFFKQGVNDITLAVGIAPNKIERAFGLIEKGLSLNLLTDNQAVAILIAERAKSLSESRKASVLIEINCGDNRCGIQPDDLALFEIAKTLQGNNVELAGILTHAGQSYSCETVEEIEAVAEDERCTAVKAAKLLRTDGFEFSVVSVGSTPTATHARSLEGVTEMRPGVYLFGDTCQASLYSLPLERVAVSVLTTVLGVYEGHFVLDAGGLAMSKDQGSGHTGYGQLASINGRPFDGAFIEGASQEHGVVRHSSEFSGVSVGDKFRIYPNHICMTAAAYDRYHVVDNGQQVIAEWQRCNGWS